MSAHLESSHLGQHPLLQLSEVAGPASTASKAQHHFMTISNSMSIGGLAPDCSHKPCTSRIHAQAHYAKVWTLQHSSTQYLSLYTQHADAMLVLGVVQQLHLSPIKKKVLDRKLEKGGCIALIPSSQAVRACPILGHCRSKPEHDCLSAIWR